MRIVLYPGLESMDPVLFVAIVSTKERKVPLHLNSRIILERLRRILPDNMMRHQDKKEGLQSFRKFHNCSISQLGGAVAQVGMGMEMGILDFQQVEGSQIQCLPMRILTSTLSEGIFVRKWSNFIRTS